MFGNELRNVPQVCTVIPMTNAPTMLTAADIFRTGGGASRLHAICLNHGMSDDAIERLSIRRLISTVDRLLAADRAGE